MTVFHSGHLFHLPKLSGQPCHGQKTLIIVKIFPTIFSGDFSYDFFFQRYFPTPTTSSGAQKGNLQLFSKHRSQKSTHAPFFFDSLNPTHRCVRAHDPFLVPSIFQQARPAPSCTSKPPSVLSEPCFSIFLAFQPPPTSDGNSLPWPRPVCALGRPLLHL